MVDMRETRLRADPSTGTGPSGTLAHDTALDDWLGDISDDDWSEQATERAQRIRSARLDAVPSHTAGRAPLPTPDRPAPDATATAAEAHRAVIERRRLVAGILLAAVLGLAVVGAVLLLRGEDEAAAPSVTAPVATTPAPEDRPSPTPTTPATTTPSTGTPPAGQAPTSGFTLPAGTKLQLGAENDAALVRELQLALTKAGYDPGPADGVFGKQTEEAVVAFQQDNGLAVDGRVGPETAAALDSALAGG